MRNIAINLTIVEAICDFASIFFYIRRRSRLVLDIDILNFIFVLIGLYGKVRLSYAALVAHSLYTLSIVGGFYIYIMIDAYIVELKNQEHLHEGQMSQFKVLLFTSLPLLGIFAIGIVSCILLLRLDDEMQQRKK